MAWRLTGNPKTQVVTHTLANKFATMDPAPDDRPLSEVRLKVYEKLIKEGHFRPCSWAAAYCRETGGTYRVNGKHTSTLMAGLDAPLPDLYAVIEYYECDTLQDVSRLYATYDSKMQSRSASDIYRSFAGCVPGLKDVSGRIIDRAPTAIWYAWKQDSYRSTQPQERAEVLLDHPDFVMWVDSLIGGGGKGNGHLRRMPVMGAMFLTYQKSPKIARDFWEAVRDETGETPGLPDRKLARWLMINSSGVRGQKVSINSRFRIKDREFFVKCLHAWNAFRNGETTNLNYHPNAEIPSIK